MYEPGTGVCLFVMELSTKWAQSALPEDLLTQALRTDEMKLEHSCIYNYVPAPVGSP